MLENAQIVLLVVNLARENTAPAGARRFFVLYYSSKLRQGVGFYGAGGLLVYVHVFFWFSAPSGYYSDAWGS